MLFVCNFIWLVSGVVFIAMSQVTAKGISQLKQHVSYHSTEPAHKPELNLEGMSAHGVTKLLSLQPWIALGPICIQDPPSMTSSCWQDSCPIVKDGGLPLTTATAPGPFSVPVLINSFLLLSSCEHCHMAAHFITVTGRTWLHPSGFRAIT